VISIDLPPATIRSAFAVASPGIDQLDHQIDSRALA
jgi:hypothetical protein